MSTEFDKLELAKHYLSKANNCYEDALLLKRMDRYESAANRLYYSLFHTTNAILATKGFSAGKHKGVKSLFDMYFIKTNIIDKKYSKLFNTIKEIREDSDYESFYIIDKVELDVNFEKVKEYINFTQEFITSLE
jgi:uncharacterized protein (UPF0332 family)